MVIKNFTPYSGQNCEVSTDCNLLCHAGIDIPESLVFGISEGLGFIYWSAKYLDFPFIGGRIKQDVLTDNLCKNLKLRLTKKETSSVDKAWENVKTCIDDGLPVGLKLDCYHLDYFSDKVHFAAHYVAIYGYDDEYAYVVDTLQQPGAQKVTLKNLAAARNERGPMSSRNLSYTIEKVTDLPDLKPIIISAINRNAADFLNPPIANIGYKGIIKMSKEVKKWFTITRNIAKDLCFTAEMMEKGGTGGALFRNYYRDFLEESLKHLQDDAIKKAYEVYKESAVLWEQVSSLIDRAGKTHDQKFLQETSELLLDIAELEKKGMEILSTIGNE